MITRNNSTNNSQQQVDNITTAVRAVTGSAGCWCCSVLLGRSDLEAGLENSRLIKKYSNKNQLPLSHQAALPVARDEPFVP